MNRELIIDVRASEIVIALLEDKQLVELNKEKNNSQFTVGDIYLGKVRKMMPGLNAAFVDVGYSKDAFLHYLDLGPQFQSLNHYVQSAILGRPIENNSAEFEVKPDIDKNGKISDVLRSGQYILVQIAKEPISTKGPRLSAEISIAGRYLVLMPFSNKVSVSQKIKSKEERKRLKLLILSIKPENYGVIVRTVANDKRIAVLDEELKELVHKWEKAFEIFKNATPPKLVIGEVDRTTGFLRDMLNSSFERIALNDKTLYNEIKEYISGFAPESQKIVKYYDSNTPIFEHFGVTKQIKGSFGKTVNIKNGAYLIIEHTEALHVIDVNSGNRSKGSKDQETNALEVNLIAAQEIARQLRLRDMGGIIVVDFIDMRQNEHKVQLYEAMKVAMESDRTKHNILPLSKFGLMQITRQRVRPEMNIETVDTSPTCERTDEIVQPSLIVEEIESNIKYIVEELKLSKIILRSHPFIIAYLKQGFIPLYIKWTFRHKIIIKTKAVHTYSILEYHLFDKNEEEIII